jgi:hypothetical protein
MHACMQAGRGGEMNEYSSNAVQSLVAVGFMAYIIQGSEGETESFDPCGMCWAGAGDTRVTV